MPESKDVTNNTQGPAMQPGVVISPSSQPAAAVPQPTPQPAPQPAQPQPQPAQPQPQPQPSPQQVSPAPQPQPQPQPASQPPAPAQITPEPEPAVPPEQPEADATAAEISEDAVTWKASEFVAHDKTSSWYITLAIGAVILAALIYLITRDAISVAVVIAAALILGIFGARKPRQLDYGVDPQGISIGDKHRGYGEFKSFTIVPEGALSSIELMPLKRFAPILTIYFAPEDEQKILAVLSTQLPYEEPRHDAVDNLIRRIRF